MKPSLTALTGQPACGQIEEKALDWPATGWVTTTCGLVSTTPPPTGTSPTLASGVPPAGAAPPAGPDDGAGADPPPHAATVAATAPAAPTAPAVRSTVRRDGAWCWTGWSVTVCLLGGWSCWVELRGGAAGALTQAECGHAGWAPHPACPAVAERSATAARRGSALGRGLLGRRALGGRGPPGGG